jgi:CRISPR system Cascade subunit CasB
MSSEFARNIAAGWWLGLQPNRRDGTRNPTADRGALARLRRADLIAAMDEAATFDLFRQLGCSKEWELPNVALCAAVLAGVRENEGIHPARTLGPEPGGKASTATMSPLRFRRLVEATEPDDRLIALRRAVMLGDRRLSVRGLADACLDWSEPTRRTWIFQYYNAGAAAPDEDIIVAKEPTS